MNAHNIHLTLLCFSDMAQLRFKANRYMQPGLYIRGDRTRVYFFERGALSYDLRDQRFH